MANLVSITVQSTDNATRTIEDIRSQLQSLSGYTASPSIDVKGTAAADTEIEQVSDSVTSLGSETATPTIDLRGSAEAVAEAEAVSAAVNKVGSSGNSAGGDLESLGLSLGKLSNLGMPALIGAGVALSPVIATLGTGLAGFGLAAEQTISPIMKAASATGGLQANMGSLSPVQQQMAQGLLGLQAQVGKFSASLQPQVVSVWGASLSLASGILTDIQPVAKATGSALAGVITSISADLKTSQWQQFFGFMAQEAGPDIKQLGDLFIGLMNDLPPLLTALQPVASGFLTLATDATEAVSALEKVEQIGKGTSDSANSVGLSLGGVESAAKRAGEQLLNSLFPGFSKTVDVASQLASSADKASKSTTAVGTSAQAAVTPVQQLSSALSAASTDTTQLDTAWGTLVGNFASAAGSVVAAKTAVENYGKTVEQSGSQSLAAQGQFFAVVQSIGQMTDAETKNHAPASQLYKDITDQITALKSKGPLNDQEKQALGLLQQATDGVANSTAGLTTQTQNAASAVEKDFVPQLKAAHTDGTTLNTDMKNLANSILNTGTQSSASQGNRQKLISDLEASGKSSSDAKALVDKYIGSVKSIPANASTKITAENSQALQSVQQAKDYLASLPKQVDVFINVQGFNISAGGLNSPHAAGGTVGAAADGGGRSGMTLVGEHGPEIVRLPVGSRVSSNPDTSRMLGGDGSAVHITLELGDSFRQAGLSEQQLEDIRYTVRTVGGGSTQSAFGRN